MYKLLAAVVLVLGLGSCVSSQKAGQRASERQEVRRQVDEALDNRSFTVTFDYVMPHRLPARYLTTTYSLSVNGDSIDSYLPYFGVAYRSKYPDDMRSPLIFSGRATGLAVQRYRKDARRVTFGVKNGDELLGYNLIVFDNGRASLNVQSSDREAIDFSGNVSLPASRKRGSE